MPDPRQTSCSRTIPRDPTAILRSTDCPRQWVCTFPKRKVDEITVSAEAPEVVGGSSRQGAFCYGVCCVGWPSARLFSMPHSYCQTDGTQVPNFRDNGLTGGIYLLGEPAGLGLGNTESTSVRTQG